MLGHRLVKQQFDGKRVMAMRLYYVFPTERGHWLVAREDETGLMFQTKERALTYVRSVAEAHRPSAVVELNAQGDEVSRQDYL